MEKKVRVYVWSKERGMRVLKEGADFQEYKKRYPSALKVKKPSFRQLEKWSCAGVVPALDRCRVEPDGVCQHGYPSQLIAWGLM